MKKLLILMLAMVLAFSLAACGGETNNSSADGYSNDSIAQNEDSLNWETPPRTNDEMASDSKSGFIVNLEELETRTYSIQARYPTYWFGEWFVYITNDNKLYVVLDNIQDVTDADLQNKTLLIAEDCRAVYDVYYISGDGSAGSISYLTTNNTLMNCEVDREHQSVETFTKIAETVVDYIDGLVLQSDGKILLNYSDNSGTVAEPKTAVISENGAALIDNYSGHDAFLTQNGELYSVDTNTKDGAWKSGDERDFDVNTDVKLISENVMKFIKVNGSMYYLCSSTDGNGEKSYLLNYLSGDIDKYPLKLNREDAQKLSGFYAVSAPYYNPQRNDRQTGEITVEYALTDNGELYVNKYDHFSGGDLPKINMEKLELLYEGVTYCSNSVPTDKQNYIPDVTRLDKINPVAYYVPEWYLTDIGEVYVLDLDAKAYEKAHENVYDCIALTNSLQVVLLNDGSVRSIKLSNSPEESKTVNLNLKMPDKNSMFIFNDFPVKPKIVR